MTLEEVIEYWKKNEVDKCLFTFDCGGDSMGNTECVVYTKDEVVVDSPDIVGYIDDVIYDEVEFYVNSDGHYQGEAGVVTITLVEDEESEPYLQFDKESLSLYDEQIPNVIEIELTPEELLFVEKFVRRVLGSLENQRCIFKQDSILSDEDQVIQEDLMMKIFDTCVAFQDPDMVNEAQEWFDFTTQFDESDSELTIEEGKLKVLLNQTYQVEIDD
jgi:hypothetical protein